MFGIGMQELLIVLAVALIVLGPKKLPELARNLGRLFAEFQRTAQDLRSSVDFDDGEAKKSTEEKKEWEEVEPQEPPEPGSPEVTAEASETSEEAGAVDLAKPREGEGPSGEGTS